MTAPEDFTAGLKTERMTEIALAFRKTGAMLAAIELGLFTHIARGAKTLVAIADALGVGAAKADRLLTACKSMDLVREVDGRYENLSDVQRYLVKDSRGYFGDYLAYMAHRDYAAWEHIADNLTAAAENNEDDERTYLSLMQDPEAARKITVAGYESSIGLGHKLAKEFDFSRFTRWLDLGGGSGCYAIPACQRHAGITVTLLDQPNVIAVAQEFIAKHGLTDRIETTPGEFFGPPFPTGYDLASYITPLQGYYAGQGDRGPGQGPRLVATGRQDPGRRLHAEGRQDRPRGPRLRQPVRDTERPLSRPRQHRRRMVRLPCRGRLRRRRIALVHAASARPDHGGKAG